ncbi:hypothetical protein GWA97_13470, partial [Flavobacterium sp. LaA7.5]|nr:hypothetical protein [Flavobacterium salilacus subsp. altitudinum]
MKKITLMFFILLSSLCGYAQGLPLEGFDTPGVFPPTGWEVHDNGIGPAAFWVQATGLGPQPAYSEPHAAYLNRENVATGIPEDWLVTPAFEVPDNPQLRFWSRLTLGGDDGSIYRIMITTNVTDAFDATNYTNIQEWTELEINPSQTVYTEKVVTIPDTYIGQDVKIAFVMVADNGDRWLVDDVQVVEQCLDPTDLSAFAGLDSADLDWTNTSGATSWEVIVLPAAGIPNVDGVIYNGEPPYTATETVNGIPLTENTDYKFYVRALCADGGTSELVGPFLFSTVALGETCGAPIEITALPYSTIDNTSGYGDDYSGSPGASGCGVTFGYLDGDDVVYSYTAAADGVISIDMTENGAYSGMFVYDDCADIGVSCVAGGVGGFAGDDVSIPDFAVTAGTTYYIVISTWASPQTTPYTLTIQQVNCAPPVGLPTTGIGQTSAQLSWTNPSGAASWEVVVQAPGSGIPAGAGETAGTNTNYLADDLTAATPYEYYVRADCGDGTFSAWAGPYPFNTTICEVEDQCAYSFIMIDSFGDGWNGNTMTVSQNGITVATLGPTFTGGSGPITVTVQMCDDLPFQLYWNAGGNWAGEVGVSVQNSFGQTLYTKAPGVGTQNSLLYTGDIDCDNPACLPPEGLTATNMTTTTAELGWAGPATGEWEYYVVEDGEPAPTDTTVGEATTTNPTTATGLTIATNYQYYVRLICSDTESSVWAGPFDFATAVCEAEDQCDYTFIMSSNFFGGWYGGTMVISQNGATVATIGSTFTSGPTQSVTVPLCHDTPFEIFWENGGTFPYQVGLSVINSFDQTLYNMPFDTEVPGTVLYSGDADCITPACLAPENLTVISTTTTTAELSWAGPATGNWEYYVVEEGEPAPTDTTVGELTTTNPVTATGLTAATNYEYYVRVICNDTQSSPWAGPFAFNTTVCEPEEQCNYIFELTDTFGDGWNGNTMTISQAGVAVATIGSTFTTGTGPVTVEVPLCPDEEFTVFWNAGGAFAGEVGFTIYTPFAEDVFTKAPGTGAQNTLLYTGTANCTPPACPKPQDIVISDVELTTAMIEWTEMGTADTWEVAILPVGSPEPTEPGTVTTENPYFAEDLEPGTPYVVYIRANCGEEDGYSNWSGPIQFVTALANDDCDGAIDVPVNPAAECIEFESGTITGATGSGVTQTCVTWTTINFDVWYSFVAEANTHSVSITDVTGGVFLQQIIFEGDDCGTLTQVACGGTNQTVTDLTPGNTYYVMVYTTFFNNPAALTSFNICVNTPEPPITVNDTEYTVEELVQDVLIGVDCAIVSNVTSVSGSDFGQSNSIGYFDQNGSNFPFQNGIVMATSGITEAPGPWPGTATFDNTGWPGDADLSAIISEGGNTGNIWNATVLEFDFVPFIDEISFNFLFASDEYGTFQCSFSDAFAFILTGPTTAVDGDNLAVIPGTTIPVSVVNIRDNQYNTGCASANVEYFGQFNQNNPAASQTGYNGQTIPMVASASVTPGETYHIKLVIADYLDSGVNSAVFLDGGSFAIGAPDLGSDLTIEGGNAACDGEEIVLDTEMDPDTYDFTWFQDGIEMEGETEPVLIVTENGTYTVNVLYENTECSVETEVIIEYYDPVVDITGEPQDLTICDASGFGNFDLSVNDDPILALAENPGDYIITYHTTQEDADNNLNPVGPSYDNEVQYTQTIYARITNSETSCYGVKEFELIIQDLTPEFEITEDLFICEGSSGLIEIVAGNYDPALVTYVWTQDGDVIDGETSDSLTVTEAGIYEVTVNNTGCEATATVNVTIVPTPAADVLADVTACDSYVLEPLSPDNNYYTGTGGTGIMLSAGETVTSTQTIFIYAVSEENQDCTNESSFTVTINDTPVVTTPGDQVACESYVLPALTVGNYYTGAGGTGTMLNEGEAITTDQTIFIYA